MNGKMDLDANCSHYRRKVQPVMAPKSYQIQGPASVNRAGIEDTYDILTRVESENTTVLDRFAEGANH